MTQTDLLPEAPLWSITKPENIVRIIIGKSTYPIPINIYYQSGSRHVLIFELERIVISGFDSQSLSAALRPFLRSVSNLRIGGLLGGSRISGYMETNNGGDLATQLVQHGIAQWKIELNTSN